MCGLGFIYLADYKFSHPRTLRIYPNQPWTPQVTRNRDSRNLMLLKVGWRFWHIFAIHICSRHFKKHPSLFPLSQAHSHSRQVLGFYFLLLLLHYSLLRCRCQSSSIRWLDKNHQHFIFPSTALDNFKKINLWIFSIWMWKM